MDLWSNYVDFVDQFTNGSYCLNVVIVIAVVEIFTFILPSLFLTFCDHYGYLIAYRVDNFSNPKPGLIWKAYKEALIGVFVVHPIQLGLAARFLQNSIIYDKNPPSWTYYFFFHLASYFTNEFFFYWTHRAFHEFPSLYKLHKKHHEFNITVGVAAQYAHPVEAFVCNLLPTMSGPIIHIMIFGHVHMCHVGLFLALRLLQTTEAHSGYHFKFPWSIEVMFLSGWLVSDIGEDVSSHHYFHHSANKGNYSTPFLDWLFGTDEHYRKYLENARSQANKKKA